MTRVTTLQITNLVKSFTLFFFGFTFLWGFSNYIVIHDVLISWPIFIVNIILAVGFGYWYYRQRYHTVLIYNHEKFELLLGKRRIERKWTGFKTVSLFHQGHGEFTIRLYEADTTYLEIPVSALKLNPQEFRFKVMDMVKGYE